MSNQSRQEVQTTESKPIDVFKRQLTGALPTIQPLLPAHVTVEKFQSMVISAIISNPDLLNADRGSLMQAVADTADMGLSLNKNMREADILLVSGKAQMRPRYEGITKLAMQSGEIIDVYAHEVYENDHFAYELGLNKKLEHTPAEGDRGALTQQAYCVWKTKHGVTGFEVIGPARVARAKAASEGLKAFKAGKIKSTPWVTDEAQMIRKTAIRAAAPYMPKSTESDKFQRALAMSDDTAFEDEDHVGVPSEPRIIPPRPSRHQAEVARQDDYEMNRQFRQTMAEDTKPSEPAQKPEVKAGGDPRPEPPAHDPETGEVTQPSGPDSASSAPASDAPNQRAAQGQAAPVHAAVDHGADAQKLIDLITKASSLINLNKIVTNRGEEIEILRIDAPAEHQRVTKAIEERKKWFAR